MSVPTLNEASRCWVKVKFFDKNAAPQTPSSVRYRIDCETTGQTVLDWTAFGTDTVIEIFVDAPLNAIINSRNPIERKVMTVQANADTPDEVFNETQQWDVINLQGI